MNRERDKILENFDPSLQNIKSTVDSTARLLADCDVEAVKKAVKFVIQDKVGLSRDQKRHCDRLLQQSSLTMSDVMKEFQ